MNRRCEIEFHSKSNTNYSVAFTINIYAYNSVYPTIGIRDKKYPISVNGKPSELIRIEQKDGTWGFHGKKGQWFDVVVKNNLDKPTVIHYKGTELSNLKPIQ